VIERLLAAAAGTGNGQEQGAVAALGPDGAALVATLARGPGALPAADGAVDTNCAGVYLLLRSVTDARLPALIDRLGAPPIGAILLGFGLRWSSEAACVGGRIDPGLVLLGGPQGPRTLDDLRDAWAVIGRRRQRRWQAELLALPGLADPAAEAELPALAHGQLGLPHADRVLALGALALLHAWARWLRGFSASSAPFLLNSFVRRPGRVARVGDDLVVWLEPRPLDVLLTLAGYTDELDLTPLYGRGRLRFEVGGS
jgi:hypothetical protein